MYYAVVAPEFSAIYTEWAMVERAHVFYPYIRWKKLYTREQAEQFIQRNKCSAKVNMYNYGDTFPDMYITVSYEILENAVRYTIDTRKMGQIRVYNPDYLIEYGADKIVATLPNIMLSDSSISSHMSVVYNLLLLVGEYVDVNLIVPNYSIFYALAYYKKSTNRSVAYVKDYINGRACKVGYTLRRW